MGEFIKRKRGRNGLAGLIGAGLGLYFKLMLIFPVVFCFVCYGLLRKLKVARLEHFESGISAIVGFILWALESLLDPSADLAGTLCILTPLIIGLIWLIWKPGKGSVWYFLILEGLVVLIAGLGLVAAVAGVTKERISEAELKGGLVGLGLLVFTMVSLWKGLKKQKQQQNAPTETPLEISAV